MPLCRANVTIVNRLGLHARPAMVFVDAASLFKSTVTVRRDDQEVDGKSIMMMMLLAATQGTQLEIICDGEDAEEALAKLVALVNAGFDDE